MRIVAIASFISFSFLTLLTGYEWPPTNNYEWPNTHARSDNEDALWFDIHTKALATDNPLPRKTKYLLVFTDNSGGCAACNQFKPVLQKMKAAGWTVADYPNSSAMILVVDVNTFKEFTTSHEIEAYPTMIMVEHDTEVRRHVGVTDIWGVGTLYKGRPCTPQNP